MSGTLAAVASPDLWLTSALITHGSAILASPSECPGNVYVQDRVSIDIRLFTA